jgi:hypothetical protein
MGQRPRARRHYVPGCPTALNAVVRSNSIFFGQKLADLPRGERPRVPATRLIGWLLADQVQGVRRTSGCQARAARMGCSADPLEGKRSAQASADHREGTMKVRKRRDTMAARCHARQRDPAPPGDARQCTRPQTDLTDHLRSRRGPRLPGCPNALLGETKRSAHRQRMLADQAPPGRRYRGVPSLRGGDWRKPVPWRSPVSDLSRGPRAQVSAVLPGDAATMTSARGLTVVD